MSVEVFVLKTQILINKNPRLNQKLLGSNRKINLADIEDPRVVKNRIVQKVNNF